MIEEEEVGLTNEKGDLPCLLKGRKKKRKNTKVQSFRTNKNLFLLSFLQRIKIAILV